MAVADKKYVKVVDKVTLNQLIEHINSYEVLAIDTETDSLNPRKGKIVGWSVSGARGEGYYFPTWVYNRVEQKLEEVCIEGKAADEISKKILKLLEGKKLVAHNASFDFRFIKNYYKLDLIPYMWVDTAMLVHTVQEEGAFGYGNPFGLKSIAIMNQEALGLDVEKAANEEQLKLKESIKANGGSTTKESFEIYKADLDILAEYGAADTDLTLRICNLYLEKLREQGLEKFFFEEEVMPIYREVTIPMEERGVALDMDLLRETDESITRDLAENRQVVVKSLLETEEGKNWVVDTAFKKYPPKNKGRWAQELCTRYSINLPRTSSGGYSMTKKAIEDLEDSPVKSYLLTGNIDLLDPVEVTKISLALWKEENEGEFVNIQSTVHLGEIVFKYMGIKSKSKTATGKDQFDMEMLEELAKTYPWAENLRVYNKLLKIKSTYVDRFINGSEDGRYYFYYKQNGTVSGRYGSDAQQLPKPKEDGQDVPIVVHYNNLVRAFLIAGEGRKFIDADYTSLEPHCVDPEGLVTVQGSIKKLDEVKEGDFIDTVDGPRKVLKKWYSNKDAFRIRHRRGELIASADHKFYVQGKGWTKVAQLRQGDILESIPQGSQATLSSLPLYPGKVQEIRKPLGSVEITDELGYFAGILLGDGMIQDGTVGLVGYVGDDLLDYFENVVTGYGYNAIRVVESETVQQVRVVSRDFHSYVKNTLQIVDQRGKRLLRVPKWMYCAESSVRVAFLAGLVDTDGGVSVRGNEFSISSKDSRFLTDLAVLGQTLGLDPRLSKRSTRKSQDGMRMLEWGTVRFAKADVVKLQQEYHILDYLRVSRKKVLAKEGRQGGESPLTDILEIIPVGERTLVDITVEGNQEFIYDGIRTHNCFASVAGDERLREIFNKGWDFYSTIAIRTEKLDEQTDKYPNGVSPDTKSPVFLKKIDPVKRNTAKGYALGIAYGMESYALGMGLGIPQKEAEKLVNGYLDGFPQLKEWRVNSREHVKKHGYIKNYVGRVRHLDNAKKIYDKFGEKILDWKFRQELEKTYGRDFVTKLYRDYKSAMNNCLNYQLQSLAAAVVNRAALQINRRAKQMGIDAQVAMQVHDQLIIDVAESQANTFMPIVRELMETTTVLPGVDLKAPPEISDNLRDGHS